MARSGRARCFVRQLLTPERKPEGWFPIQVNDSGSVCIAQALPAVAEINRRRETWLAFATIDNLTASGTGSPTSADTIPVLIFNNEPPGGKSYVIDTVTAWVTANATPAVNEIGIRVGIDNILREQGFPGQFGRKEILTPKSLSGSKGYRGLAFVENAVNQIAVSRWIALNPAIVSANTAKLTLSLEARLNGRFVVPPGGLFGAIGTSTGAEAGLQHRIGVIWHEVSLAAD